MPGETNEVNWRGVRPVEGISGIWPARNATRVQASDYQSGEGSTTIYTVPAGKKLFISTLIFNSQLKVAAQASAIVWVKNGGGVEQYKLVQHYYVVVGDKSEGYNYVPAQEALASWYVEVYCNDANMDARPMIYGWLEDV